MSRSSQAHAQSTDAASALDPISDDVTVMTGMVKRLTRAMAQTSAGLDMPHAEQVAGLSPLHVEQAEAATAIAMLGVRPDDDPVSGRASLLAALDEAKDREASLRATMDVLALRLDHAQTALTRARHHASAVAQTHLKDLDALREAARKAQEIAVSEVRQRHEEQDSVVEAALAAALRWSRLLGRSIDFLSEKRERPARSVQPGTAIDGRFEQTDSHERHPPSLEPPRSGLKRRSRASREADLQDHLRVIRHSKLFHPGYYLGHFPDGLPQGSDPLQHYVTVGWRTGINPSPLFSVPFYLLRNPDLVEAGVEPLRHYIESGSTSLLDPHPAFLTSYYAARCPAEKPADVTWLRHFLRLDTPSLSPHPLFDPVAYATRAGLKEEHAAVALLHYLLSGWKSGLPFSILFDADYYRSQADTPVSAFEAYEHYVVFGASRGLNPHPLFDTDHYLRGRPEVNRSVADPIADYVLAGEAAGATPNPFFDPVFYRDQYMAAGTAQTALEHYLKIGAKAGHDPHPDFDARAYALLSQGGASQPSGALDHFLRVGLHEITWSKQPEFAPRPREQRARLPGPTAPAVHPAPDPSALSVRHFPGKIASKPDRPNVLVVAHAAAEHLFGSERSLLDMLDGLSHVPANVLVALPRNVPTYTNAIRALCQDVFVLDYRWWRKNEGSSPSVVAAFKTIIAERRITAVHVNTIMLREALEAARACDVPGIVHVRELIGHDAALQELIGQAPQAIVAETKRRSDWIIGNSHATAAAFEKPDRTAVIPNAIDLAAMDLQPRTHREEIRFGLISSNIPKKGLLDVVKLARLAADRCPKARFVIIGPETDLVRDLKHQQGSGDVPGNITFPGYAATPKDAIAQLDVVLNFSHFAESFGRTVLEAMASRRPVIAYAWGAIPELVEDGETGMLIPFRKPELALAAVEALCSDPDLIGRMGEKGRAIAEARYGFDSYRKAFARAYAKILPPDRPALRSETALVVHHARRPGLKTAETALKLAYFCWHFPVPSESFVLSELEHLVRGGTDVIVFCRQSPHKTFKPDFPISWERVDSPGRLAQRLRETGRTIVHAHFTYPTVTDMVWPACEEAQIPFTFMAHAQDIFRHENDRKNRLREIGASPLCRALFTLSQFHLGYVSERGFPRDKIIINPNAVDMVKFAAAAMPDREARRTRRIIAISRFVEKKGLSRLIEAAALLGDLDVRIDIYGYGEGDASYRALVEKLKLTNVTLNGPLTHAEVVETMRHADLFACPSVRAADGDMDGIPTSLVESMAAGLPVLTTSVAGIPDLVVDGVTGFVTDPTPEGIAATIRRFYAVPDLKLRGMIESARRQATARHDVVATTRVLERVWCNRTVDIVAVSWNNLTELQAVLRCALANTSLPFHLIVCDNQSGREPVAAYLDQLWAEDDRVTVIHNSRNAMVGPGTNVALAQGVSDYAIYICGKECISFKRGWELPFVQALEQDPGVGLVGSIGYSPTYLRGSQYPTGIPLFAKFRNPDFAADNASRVFGHVQGGLFGMRRSMVDAIGGFSEDVPHDYTDVEYSYYAESRGWKLAQAPGVLALFNKSRPTLSQRFDEGVVVAHPVHLDQVRSFQSIADGSMKHCNMCDWFGPAFEAPTQACPHCKALPEDRTVQRWLSDGILMFRRLAALGVGLSGSMEKLWAQQFQGPRLSVESLLQDLKLRGRLSNRPGTFAVALIRYEAMAPEPLTRVARELRRVLTADALALFQLDGTDGERWTVERQRLTETMRQEGFSPAPDVVYASRSLGYSYVPMIVFQRTPLDISGGPPAIR